MERPSGLPCPHSWGHSSHAWFRRRIRRTRATSTFDNVQFDDLKEIKVIAGHADLKFGPGAVNLKVAGEGVTVRGTPCGGKANACTGKFVPMPVR